MVARLTALGATPAGVGQGEVPWQVMADPEGNVFCVLEPRPAYADTGPIAAIVVHCTDPRAIAQFWDQALDWTLHEVGEDCVRLRSAAGVGPYLEFVPGPSPDALHHRMHLDLKPYAGDDPPRSRLVSRGARPIDIGQGEVSWRVLSDPNGNEFCVLAPGGAPDPDPTGPTPESR